MRVSGIWRVLAVVWGAEVALAQSTTVQLPTYRTFGVRTAVTVPDRGSVYLGGINRAYSGRNEFGTPLLPFRNRSFGTQRSASGVSVSVYIHDFEELEREVLSRAGGSDPKLTTLRAPDGTTRAVVQSDPGAAGSGDPRRTLADGPGDPRRTPDRAAPLSSIEEIRRQRLADQEARQAEAEDFFERGQTAEAAGKTNVARIYYQMTAKRASGLLKEEVLAKLDAFRREPPSKLARSEP